MRPEMPIPDIASSNIASNQFHHFVGGYVLGLPCIITDNNTVFVHDDYLLIDFGDNGSITERKVRFYDASLRGYTVTIVVLEQESGELIKRRHRLNNDSLPCDWVLTDYFNPKNRKDELLAFDY